MTVSVEKLPFGFSSNLPSQPVTGTVEVHLIAKLPNSAVLESAASAVETWTEIVNHQWLSVNNRDAYASAQDQQRADSPQSVILSLEVRDVDSAAWLVLLGLLAQIYHAEPELVGVQIIHVSSGETLRHGLDSQWAKQAETKLYTVSSPHPLITLPKEYVLDEPIDVDIEFINRLSSQQIEHVAEGLEYWGYLVGMGACRFDFVEPDEFYADFGATAPLTADSVRYTKDNFDGPIETVHLLKYWINGLERHGIGISSAEVSQ